MIDQLIQQHQAVSSQFNKLDEASKTLGDTRQQLDQLALLGDMVTPDDVIKSAGELVATGASPLWLAKLLSDLPDQGPQIQAWLQDREQQLAQHEQALQPMLSQGRHELGLAGMRLLVGHQLGAPAAAGGGANPMVASPGPSAAESPNPLMAAGGASNAS